MRPSHPKDRARRRCRRLGIENLEDRFLLAYHPIHAAGLGGQSLVAQVEPFVPVLYPPGTPQPTAAEVRREAFIDKAVGRYTIGPGHFDTQSIMIHGFGKKSASNASFITRFQYSLFTPQDPSQSITGVMHFLPANFLAGGGSLILDLQGPTGSEVNGLPTHLYWIHDGTSGTEFTGTGGAIPGFNNFPANYFTPQGTPANPPPGPNGPNPSSVDNWNMGFGDATFQYIPDRHPVPGSLGSGKVVLVFKGLLNTSASQNPADKHYM